MDAATFSALGEPTRLRIVEVLRESPRSVSEIASQLDLRQPQTTKHLQVLSRAGLVRVTPMAQQRIYALQPDAFALLGEWVGSFERHWNQRLNRLDQHLQTMKERRT
jgi:DNA-binding transcriptional ArsR family regulator